MTFRKMYAQHSAIVFLALVDVNVALANLHDSADRSLLSTSTSAEASVSIAVNPKNPNNLLCGARALTWPTPSSIIGAVWQISTDGGVTWGNLNYGVQGNFGFPTVGINTTGMYSILYINPTQGVSEATSTDGGSTWYSQIVAYPPDDINCQGDCSAGNHLERSHLWIDTNPSSSFKNYRYAAWTYMTTEYTDSVNYGRMYAMSTSPSGPWYYGQFISHSNPNNHEWNAGVQLSSGPIGGSFRTYAVWSVYYNIAGLGFPVYDDEDRIGFAQSQNGGQTWLADTRLPFPIKGINGTQLSGKTMDVHSFPSIAVNQQNGHIYVVWCNLGVPGGNVGDPDIYFTLSTDAGSTWSQPSKVNQDQSFRDQWFPKIACDPNTGALAVVYYDSRDNPNRAETYISVSQNEGATWEDLKVSDTSWSGNGGTGNYAGSYIDVAMKGNTIYPVWADDRTGKLQIYLSPVHIPSDWNVPASFFEISDALDLASSGDRILVGVPGGGRKYNSIFVADGVEIVGSPTSGTWPTVLGQGPEPAVDIRNANARVSGLEISGGGGASVLVGADFTGGRIENCRVKNLTSGPVCGISLKSGTASSCTVDMSGVSNATGIAADGTATTGLVEKCKILLATGTGINLSSLQTFTADVCTVTVATGTGVYLSTGNSVLKNSRIMLTTNQSTNYGVLQSSGSPTTQGCFISCPGGYGIYNSTGSGTVTTSTIDNVGWGVHALSGTVRYCIATNISIKGFKTSSSNKAEYCIAPGVNGFDLASQGIGSVQEDPLYCGSGVFTLRVDSYGNPTVNGHSLIGAFPVSCMFGTLSRTTRFAGGSALYVPGDVTIPAGKTLTLDATAILKMRYPDSLGTGDGTKVELVAASGGTLVVGDPNNLQEVQFTSNRSTPAEGDWWGIRVNSGGLARIDHANVQYANYGVAYQSTTAGHVSHSSFSNNSSMDILAGVGGGIMAAVIDDNLIAVGGGKGISLQSVTHGLAVSNNRIIGDQTASYAGIEFNNFENNEYPLITQNFIQSVMSGYGIYAKAASPTITKNEIQFCGYGIYTTGGAAVIGSGDPSSDNLIHQNWVGIQVDGGTPIVRNNQIVDNNNTGVLIRYSGHPDLGTQSSQGLNSFTGYTPPYTRCIDNQTMVWVDAWANYFGNCNPPTCVNGNVHTNNNLCNSPAGADLEMVALADLTKKPVVNGVSPNPLRTNGQIKFSLPIASDDVRLRIYDLAGRIVRDFGESRAFSGVNSLNWDGSDDRGSPLLNGIYFIRLTVNNHEAGAVKALVMH